jgi:hypothetical protein
MHKYRIILILLLLNFISIAQKKKELKKFGIQTITTVETRNGKTFNDKQLTYDKLGEKIEEINYDKDGNLKNTIRYKYNKEGDVIEEIEFDSKALLVEKRTMKYNALKEKTEEIAIDREGKIQRRSIFSYNANGLKTEKKVYDGSNNLLFLKKYIYGHKANEGIKSE